MEKLWNYKKSVKFTHFMVRLFYVVLIVVTAGSIRWLTLNSIEGFGLYFVPFFISVPAGCAALICLDKLLVNIKKKIVFEKVNVKLLKIFSWLCFAVFAVTFLFAAIALIRGYSDRADFLNVFDVFYAIFAFCAAVAELFVGVVVRVVKNIFEAAIKIKEENELTI